jgi:acetyl-CoA acyltransferase
MADAYLIDFVRTPIGKFAGVLAQVRADDLAALVIEAVLKRNRDIDPARIDDVILGCANQAGEDNRNVARMALLLAGLPVTVPGQTVNRLCASGMAAIAAAARAEGELFIAGGVEHMTRAPYVVSKSPEAFSRKSEMFDTSLGWRFVNPKMRAMYGIDSMGETAENVAEKFGISRADQDLFAYRSHMKAAAARFEREIVPVGDFDRDECIRPDTTPEILAALKPAFRAGGSVTAGNSSGINDGACALIVARDRKKARARFVASAAVGVEPRFMGMGPVGATRKVLERAKLSLDDMAVIELNEAFAAQCLACIRELGLKDDDPRINPNGGAIALGHPLGMSGARLIGTAMLELEQRNERYALCTMCVGVGQGMAAIIERM